MSIQGGGLWLSRSVRRGEALAAAACNDDVGYRLDLACPSGPYVVEQQAYYRTEGERISYLRIRCSGFRPR